MMYKSVLISIETSISIEASCTCVLIKYFLAQIPRKNSRLEMVHKKACRTSLLELR